MTPALEHELVLALSWGDRTLTDIAEKCGLKNIESLRSWLAAGARGDERYARLAEAVVAGRRRVAARDVALAKRAAELVEAGSSIRSAAAQLGISYDSFRAILRRARAGDPDLVELAAAAHRRARRPRRPKVCPHCGGELAGSRGEEAA